MSKAKLNKFCSNKKNVCKDSSCPHPIDNHRCVTFMVWPFERFLSHLWSTNEHLDLPINLFFCELSNENDNKTRLEVSWDTYLPVDEFPPFLLSCSASKTSRATVRGVRLKSTFSQEHINILSSEITDLPKTAKGYPSLVSSAYDITPFQ